LSELRHSGGSGCGLHVAPTADGSDTLVAAGHGASYHSRHGAVTESLHVFVGAGLADLVGQSEVGVLEVGHGSGLNAFLALRWARDQGVRLEFVGLDPEPPPPGLVRAMQLGSAGAAPQDAQLWDAVCAAPWGRRVEPVAGLGLLKLQVAAENADLVPDRYDTVFFDAFAPGVQSELWKAEVFRRLWQALRPGGRLVTYCAKGEVRRTMQAAGFRVERLPGAPGKREMLRAWRPPAD